MKTATHKIPDRVKTALMAATFIEEGISLGAPGSLPPETYRDCDKILKTLGFKWNKKAGGHIKPGCDPRAEIMAACTSGEVLNEKKTFQFFPTSPEIAFKMVTLADIGTRSRPSGSPMPTVLEPSAGDGAIIRILADLHRGDSLSLTAVEINPKMIDSLAKEIPSGWTSQVIQGDFLSVPLKVCDSHNGFDYILANPPYTAGQDAEHLFHMMSLLTRGGRIVCLAQSTFLQRTDRKTKRVLENLLYKGRNAFSGEADSGVYGFQLSKVIAVGVDKASGSSVQLSILVIDSI